MGRLEEGGTRPAAEKHGDERMQRNTASSAGKETEKRNQLLIFTDIITAVLAH